MINGEEESSRVDSLDCSDQLLHKGSGQDGSPGSSLHYSSCGESEFERYCSANSALGTPSMCSSTGPFQDSLESELENFSLGPSPIKLSSLDNTRLGNRGIRFSDGGGSCNGTSSSAPGLNTGNGNTDMIQDTGYGEGLCGDLVSGEATIEKDSVNLLDEMEDEDILCRSDSQYHTSGIDREGGSSIDDEHSDGDDDSLSDSGDHSRKYVPRNLQFQKEPKDENDNPFLINSSTAFGTNDWDEFELEATELVDTQFDFSGFEKRDKGCTESEGTSTKAFSVSLQKLPDIAQAGNRGEHTNVTMSTRLAPDVGDCRANIEDIRSRDLTVLTQREQGDIARDSITAKDFGDLSAGVKTLVVRQSLVTDESLRDSCLSNSQNEDRPVVMNYLQYCSTDDVLDITPTELGIEDPSGGFCDLDGDVSSGLLHESSENGKQSKPFGECTSEPLLASQNSDMPSSRDSHPVTNALQVTCTQPKKENTELNNFYDDFVHDMEEILLDSGESSGVRFSKNAKMFQLQLSLPNRDGGQTATTSGLDDSSPTVSQRFRIDRVEVVGVKQKKGDVSLSERLVGVKEYTVYIIRVWSGKDKWEIERRYRDFYSLYRRLTSLFADQGWTLPTPWASVERESRKIFGTSPNAVAERTVLIQDCLNSVLQSRFFPTLPNALLRFLSPQDAYANASGFSIASPTDSAGITAAASSSSYGNTISFIVDIRPQKSVKQLLEAQHYICAGCHRYFDDGATLVRDFVKALGWGKPRLCEYTGQLFCSSCHANDMAVLPARVLHHWDFNRYPVSQLAKSYLDSIHEQPMLCVSAVNPFLSSKVPALNRIMSIRKRITIMLPYVRCPFRKTLNKGLSSRRYLLESTDFFALRDLIDLSKGPFAALPAIVETVRRKILEHITEQCLVCCDVGVPCNARQACDDTSSLIFPFQEKDEVNKCRSCGSVFHKRCLARLSSCHCGAQLKPKKSPGELQVSEKKSDSTSVLPLRFLSSLFGKTKQDKETTILMGSLPTNDL
ncbi:unnamed protein product [Arabidopsis lyrata]|uniref:uncharacterized protein LOC110228172 n=1 Tax=Arabidopsis lyrata subsp. lyrata TaxID=81972 RepID=UPI000A29AF09|nr:uncharacterized protein LOC110228172 [Arabidopsis lyrata subsp. lyrata]CAH8267851.1 unnamed protein product [Arabidopsis lyrata]|eukprot:XP_020880356.1 uncharacterized protein LOC110228172 [Arabidopsis lyrata subsp. lyrata]